MRSILSWIIALTALFIADAAHARPTSRPATTPIPRLNTIDFARRLDLNRLRMVVANDGSFGFDATVGNPGLLYPAGSLNPLMFAGGLWLGTRYDLGQQVRMTVSEYSSEYTPGNLLPGAPDNSADPLNRVYKVAPWTGNPTDTAHVDRDPSETLADPTLDPLLHDSWGDYMAYAVPQGAPWRMHRIPDLSTPQQGDSSSVPGPDVSGDVMLWSVFHDGVQLRHTNAAGSCAPLGVEVQQSTFAFDDDSPLGNTVFFRWKIIHNGTVPYDELLTGVWSDPDLGDYLDDVCGYDLDLSLGYAYNGDASDGIFGAATPALGFILLDTRHSGVGQLDSDWVSFVRYVNGQDPSDSLEAFRSLSGLNTDGSGIVDPTTSLVTSFMVSGDPVAGTGWLDSAPADRRMLCATRSYASFANGDTVTVWAALVVGQGVNVNESITALRCGAGYAQSTFDGGLSRPFPPIPGCAPTTPLVNCPRNVPYWLDQTPAGDPQFTSADINRIAHGLDSLTSVFDWPDGPDEGSAFLSVLGSPGGTWADTARAEYAAFLANLTAGRDAIAPNGGAPIGLLEYTPVAGAPLAPTTLGMLAAPLPPFAGITFADYENLVATNPTPLTAVTPLGDPVDPPLGVTFASLVFASQIDPVFIDSFPPNVEIRFSATEHQLAYRFMRLERASDGTPPGGIVNYVYGGFHEVPFTVWDTATNTQLDCAFLERLLTDDGGGWLPSGSQPATFDSTWAPDSSARGARETLWILKAPYLASPNPFYEFDDVPIVGDWPALYIMQSKLVSDDAVMDDGDRIRISKSIAPPPSAETMMLWLAGQSPSDTSIARLTEQLARYLMAINWGDGIGVVCTDPTPVLVSLFESSAGADGVRLTWYLGGPPAASAWLERSDDGLAWSDRGDVPLGGDGYARAFDRDVLEGARYAYRLAVRSSEGLTYSQSVWIEIPLRAGLSLAGALPNPARSGRLAASFTLTSRAPATLDVLDLAGRLVRRRPVGALGAGRHVVTIDAGEPLAPGLYVLRLVQGAASASRKAIVVR